jgi:hypothetical protein
MLMAKNGYHIERDGLVNNEIRRPGKQYIKMTTALMKIIKDNKDPRFVDTAKIVLEFINKHADKFKSFDSAIIVSRHGYDIAGMSTGRSWKSCMRLPVNGKDGGEHYANIKDDIKYGTLVAYLVDSKDVNINKPFARVLIKPFTQGDHTIWHPESVVYPRLSVYFDFQKDLTKLVSSWMQSLQVPDGIYTKQPKLYDDDKVREITITKAGNNG